MVASAHSTTVLGSALLLVLVACGSSSADPNGPTGPAVGPSPENGSDAAVEPDAEPGSGDAGTDAKQALTGDVWVDAKGAVIGLMRTIPFESGGGVATVLVDAAGLSWNIDGTNGSISALDTKGTWYYEGANCTGKRWLGNGIGESSGNARPGVTTRPNYSVGGHFVILAPKPMAAYGQLPKMVSWDDPYRGCVAANMGASTPFGYPEADVLTPKPPEGFVAPFHVERH
jgi:hypothetical protein